jgi:hypothetical protein
MEILIDDCVVTKCLGHGLVTRPATVKSYEPFCKEISNNYLVLGDQSGTACTVTMLQARGLEKS